MAFKQHTGYPELALVLMTAELLPLGSKEQ